MVAVPNVDSTATSVQSLMHDSKAKGPDYRIPSHFGSASRIVSGSSVHMMTLINGCERSLVRAEQSLMMCH